jgi:molecular chaperone IbpA|tara:strand:- start:150 stop:596 length:447 start_codon:yes stop_codon:yes gene_type:complete
MNGLTRFTTKDLDAIFNSLTRSSVGYDDLFYRLHSAGVGTPQNSYPPYNKIKVNDEHVKFEIALAGWSKDDIEVTTQTNVLTIKSKSSKDTSDVDYVHRGVATRTFTRTINLCDDQEIGEVTFENGLLTINIHKIVPDHQKLKVYEIK